MAESFEAVELLAQTSIVSGLLPELQSLSYARDKDNGSFVANRR